MTSTRPARSAIAALYAGALGALDWLAAIWAASTAKPWARGAGAPGLPPLLGCAGLLPSRAGLLAVISLWRRPPVPPPHPSMAKGHLS